MLPFYWTSLWVCLNILFLLFEVWRYFKSMDLELSDKLLLVKHYYLNAESVTGAIRGYHYEKDIKNDHNKLSHSSVNYLLKHFLQTGSLSKSKPQGRSSNEMQVKLVSDAVADNTSSSVRFITSQVKVPKSTVHNILRQRLKLFPYKKQYDHYVPDSAVDERIHFCQKFISRFDEDIY